MAHRLSPKPNHSLARHQRLKPTPAPAANPSRKPTLRGTFGSGIFASVEALKEAFANGGAGSVDVLSIELTPTVLEDDGEGDADQTVQPWVLAVGVSCGVLFSCCALWICWCTYMRCRSARPPPPPPSQTGERARRSVVRKRYSGLTEMQPASVVPPPPPAYPPPDELLPQGWSEQIDDSSGHIFYYNEATGQSTWERPV